MAWLTIRKWFFLLFFGCAGLLAYAMFLQQVEMLEPCPLCILQRIAFVAIGLFALLAGLHNPARPGRLIYTILISISTLFGIAIAGRHVWLQHLPPELVPDCGPGLGYMLDAFPLLDTIEMVLTGSGSCAEVSWSFLGLSMPEWTLIAYIIILLGSVWMWLRSRSNNNNAQLPPYLGT